MTGPAWRRLTPGGLGAIAVYAVPRAPALSAFDLRSSAGRPRAWPAPGRFVVGRLHHRGELLDEIVSLGVARGPDGCEALEWHVHGGDGVARRVEAALLREGLAAARASDAGVATESAVPSTWRAARALLSAERGPLARLRSALDGAGRGDATGLDVAAELERALAQTRLGERLRRPAVVRIVGRPNAGKSTLFNALLGSERALVSPTAGTTRDPVTAAWALRGVAVRLEDTAGDAEADVPRAAPDAGLLVHLLSEPDEPVRDPDACGGADVLAVLGRADRLPVRPGRPDRPQVSGLTGAGLGDLIERIADVLGIPPAGVDDLYAPVDPGLAGALVRAAAGRAGAERGRHSEARIP